jgi:hypothetical protein
MFEGRGDYLRLGALQFSKMREWQVHLRLFPPQRGQQSKGQQGCVGVCQ